MVKATPFLLVLLLALGAHSLSVKKKKNDLGSNMTIYEVKENGDFTGKNFTAVSDSPLKIKESPLRESQQHP
ncbi:hypothetical protein DV515_00018413, partial [Chloebia gouldiae]